MKGKSRKAAAVRWEKQAYERDRSRMAGLISGAVWEFAAISILLLSAITMVWTVSENEALTGGGWLTIEGLLLLLVICQLLISLITERQSEKIGRLLRIVLRLALLIIIALIAIRCYMRNEELIEKGQLIIAGRFIIPYNRIFGKSIYVEPVKYSGEALERAVCFYGTTGMALLYSFSKLIRHLLPTILLPVATLSAVMLIGLAPGWIAFFLMAAGIYMAIFSRGSSAITRRMIGLAVIIILLLIGGRVFERSSEGLLDKSAEIKQIQDRIEERINRITLLFSLANKNSINNSRPRYKDKDIMSVTLGRAPDGNLYFREFYGTRYENGSWSTDYEAFEKEAAQAGFDAEEARRLIEGSAYGNGNFSSTGIVIEYHQSLGRAMMLPYGADLNSIQDFTLKGDTIAEKSITDKKKEFISLTTNELMPLRISALRLWNQKNEGDFWDWYDDYVKEHYTSRTGDMKVNGITRVLDGELVTRTGKSFYDYITIAVDDDTAGDVGFNAKSKENINDYRYRMAGAVANFLADNFEYSWELDTLKGNYDPIDYFITAGQKGYCVHFASSAVLILRSLGVPARYVSGYIAKPSAFSQKKDGSYQADLIDRNGHAWVEVYFDSVGWLPMEMTPGFSSLTAEMPTSREAEEKRRAELSGTPVPPEPTATEGLTPTPTANNRPTKTPTTAPTGSETPVPSRASGDTKTPTPTAQGGTGIGGIGGSGGTGGHTGVRVMIIIAGILILICGLAVLVRKLLLGYRNSLESELKKKQNKRAVKRMNRRIYRRLRIKSRTVRTNIKDDEYEELLSRSYPELKREELEEFMRIVKKAAFSKESIADDEVTRVYAIYRRTRGRIY